MTGFLKSTVARTLVFVALTGALAGGAHTTLSAQRSAVSVDHEQDQTAAQRVRDDFMAVLQKYPPAVAQVLKIDPSLILSDQYLAPYPAIIAFLNQHPEVRHSPAYYLEPVRRGEDNYYFDPRDRAWEKMFDGAAIFTVVFTIAGTLIWLIRTAIDYRRWGRLSKVQAEAHTKLLDRFTGNDELLAYVQSPAGARFLKSSPITLDGSNRPMGAPLARILWSMQAGLVLSAAGFGMNYVSRHIDPYRADPVFMFSVLLLSVGVGFILSAGASYAMSRRMGLVSSADEKDEQ